MANQLTALECKALEAALAGDEPWREKLRRQLPHLRVVSRQYTGVGFYTDLACEGCVAATGLPLPDAPEAVPVAWAAHPDVEKGVAGAICFNVFLKEGVIVCLEGASGTAWPETEELITFAV